METEKFKIVLSDAIVGAGGKPLGVWGLRRPGCVGTLRRGGTETE